MSDCIEYKASTVAAYVCIAAFTIIGNDVLSYVPIVRGMIWKEGTKVTSTSRQNRLLDEFTTQLRAPCTMVGAWFCRLIVLQLAPLIVETLKVEVKSV